MTTNIRQFLVRTLALRNMFSIIVAEKKGKHVLFCSAEES